MEPFRGALWAPLERTRFVGEAVINKFAFLIAIIWGSAYGWMRYETYEARARAQQIGEELAKIATLESAYRSSYGHYGGLFQIGYDTRTLRNGIYSIEMDHYDKDHYLATAVQQQKGALHRCDNGNDAWEIRENAIVVHATDGFSECGVAESLKAWFSKQQGAPRPKS